MQKIYFCDDVDQFIVLYYRQVVDFFVVYCVYGLYDCFIGLNGDWVFNYDIFYIGCGFVVELVLMCVVVQ